MFLCVLEILIQMFSIQEDHLVKFKINSYQQETRIRFVSPAERRYCPLWGTIRVYMMAKMMRMCRNNKPWLDPIKYLFIRISGEYVNAKENFFPQL